MIYNVLLSLKNKVVRAWYTGLTSESIYDPHLADHSLILCLKSEDIIIQFFPGLTKRGVNMVQDMLKTLIECLLRVILFVKVTSAELFAVYVPGLESIERMHTY